MSYWATFPEDRANMYLLDDGFLYRSRYSSHFETSRVPVVALLSLCDKPLSVKTKDKVLSGRALLVRPQVKRSLIAWDTPFVSVHIDPSHRNFSGIVHAIEDRSALELRSENYAHLLAPLRDDGDNIALAEVDRVFCAIASQISNELGSNRELDPRIDSLIDELNDASPLNYEFERLLTLTGLSAGRLSHLFTDELGISLRSYNAWRKMRRALSLMATSDSLTDIAHQSGYSDSAHFSRSFVSALGLVPSVLQREHCINLN